MNQEYSRFVTVAPQTGKKPDLFLGFIALVGFGVAAGLAFTYLQPIPAWIAKTSEPVSVKPETVPPVAEAPVTLPTGVDPLQAAVPAAEARAELLRIAMLFFNGHSRDAEQALRAAIESGDSCSEPASLAYGNLLYQNGRLDEALTVLTRLEKSQSVYRPYIFQSLGRVHHDLKNWPRGWRYFIEALKDGHPLDIEIAGLMIDAGLNMRPFPPELLQVCELYLSRFPNGLRRMDAEWARILVLDATGQIDAVRRYSERLVFLSPETSQARSAWNRLKNFPGGAGGLFSEKSPAEITDWLNRLDEAGWPDHQTTVEQFRSRCASSWNEALQTYWMIKADYKAGKVDAAVSRTRLLLVQYPNSPWTCKAAQLALARARSKDDKAGIIEFGQWLITSGGGDRVQTEARLSVATALAYRGEDEEAIGYLSPILGVEVDSPEIRDACWLAAGLHRRLGRAQTSRDILEHLLKVAPDTGYRPAALFWINDLSTSLGDPFAAEQARNTLIQNTPFDYYGHLALRKSGADIRKEPCDAVKAESNVQSLLSNLAGSRAERLFCAGLFNEAGRELETVTAQSPSESLWITIAWLYTVGGKPGLAQKLLTEKMPSNGAAYSGEHPDLFWRLQYPVLYQDLISEQSPQGAPPPSLVLGLIKQESSFRPAVVSSAGALGLLQLMPDTSARVASRLGLPKPGRYQLFQPALNLKLGMGYLGELSEKFGVSETELPYLIASYNAGPGTVAKWRERNGQARPEEWVELIPYRQTRLFVKSVLRNFWEYERLR